MGTVARHPRLASHAAVLLAAGAFAAGAGAQVRADALPGVVVNPGASASAATVRPTHASTAPPQTSFADAGPRGAGWLGNSVRLEVPRDVVTGEYARPKIIVGLPSDSMKGWVNSAGLAADHCMLPMLRARTRMTSDGEVNGTLWLYARCTFR